MRADGYRHGDVREEGHMMSGWSFGVRVKVGLGLGLGFGLRPGM